MFRNPLELLGNYLHNRERRAVLQRAAQMAPNLGPEFATDLERRIAAVSSAGDFGEIDDAIRLAHMLSMGVEVYQQATSYPGIKEYKNRLDPHVAAILQGLRVDNVGEREAQIRGATNQLYGPAFRAFADMQELTADLSGMKYDVEHGGFFVGDIDSSRGYKAVHLRFKQLAVGDERSIRFKEQPTDEDVGIWHTHPYGSYPIPSGADLVPSVMGGHMRIDQHPHIISSPRETRLYITQLMAKVMHPRMQERFVPYSPEARKAEILELGLAKDSPQLIEEMLPGLGYIVLNKAA